MCISTAWTTHDAMPTPVAVYHRPPVGPDGKVYFLNSQQFFDTVADGWDTTTIAAPPVSVGGMGDVHVYHDGKIYCFAGGFGSTYGGSTAHARLMIYDIAGNSWSQGADIPDTGRLDACAVSDGTYIYLIGGLNAAGTSQATILRYDPAGDSWDPVGTLTDMPAERNQSEAIYKDGRIYVLMGQSGGIGVSSVVIYDVAGDSWSTASEGSPVGTANGFSAALVGDTIYAGGGIIGTAQKDCWKYLTASDHWPNPSGVPDLPEGRWLPAWAAVDDILWSFGGDSGSLDGKTMCLATAPSGWLIDRIPLLA